MNGPSDGGFLARLRQNETLRKLTGGRPEIAIFGVPALAVLAVVAGVVVATAGSGGGGGEQAAAASPTTAAATNTPGTPTPGANAGLKTPLPISPGSTLSAGDLTIRGDGTPGRGEFTGQRLVIPKIGVDAPFSYKEVGTDGAMPNPNGPTDVAFYDFSQWPGLGGIPGKGGNVVLAGHVDYINYGPAVFWRLHELEPGDTIEIQLADGTLAAYTVEFNKQLEAGADFDFGQIVKATADESVTLITCSGAFEAGHYSNRQIIWGRRI